ncbi:hypothetical protein [Enterobacter kobei]|uniref:hypothetical protein n=1 Tax=Enterobacter kobei TaxID=208224 RepID=UPI000954F6CC|nr:hypothetical protein [Enterobacter kobei]SIQ91879.1 hypothetical protein SAMN05444841_102476 [Enterobacter kobei]
MSMKIAHSHHHLKRRIEEFFTARDEHQTARALIEALAERHQVWIFGGMLRDITLFGGDNFTSDIDIVFDGERDELFRLLSVNVVGPWTVNKLGGIRFRFSHMDFDMWCLSDTWAFKENLIPLIDARSLFRTTLMSWDAVLYDVHRREVITPENYLDDLTRGYLEIVLRATPNETGAIVRILRTIFQKEVKTLGPMLSDFLHQMLENYEYAALAAYEHSHFNSRSFSDSQYLFLRHYLRHAERGKALPLPCHQAFIQLQNH